MMIFVFVVTVIVLIAGIILTIFSPCFDTNIASMLKYVVAVCVFMILHILLVLLESVAQMYLTFWNKKE